MVGQEAGTRRAGTGAVRNDERPGGRRHQQQPRNAERDSAAGVRRQREEFGGINWGAAFFGWLVAAGIAVILVAILSAAGTAIGLTRASSRDLTKNAGTIGIGGGIALLVVLLVAYYSGGYVAGRMSRFDGARQGFGVWALGILITLLFAAAGVILGSKYNVLTALNLPRIPVKEGALATGGAIALAAIILGTLLVSMVGGKAGRHYHGRVDALAYER
jgi:amino acid transporter